jgi:hypothetical protein
VRQGRVHARMHSHDDIPVAAPAAGIVFQPKITLGTVVVPGNEIFTITDPSSLWMVAAVRVTGSIASPRLTERALEMGMPKTEGIRSISKLGLSMVTVVFDDSANTYFARQLVYERLQAVLGVSPQRRRSEGHGSTGPYWQHANSRDPVAVLSRTARSLPLCAGRRNALAPISNVPQRARASCINAIFLRDLS